MAIAAEGNVATATSTTSGTTLIPVGTFVAGRAALVVIAADNVQTTDGASTLVASVSDNIGNTFIKVAEFTAGRGAAGGGATVAIYLCPVISFGGTSNITITFASAITSKAASVFDFTIGAGNSLRVVGTPSTAAN